MFRIVVLSFLHASGIHIIPCKCICKYRILFRSHLVFLFQINRGVKVKPKVMKQDILKAYLWLFIVVTIIC